MVIAVDITREEGVDEFNYSIPYGVTLYEASWSHYGPGFGESNWSGDDISRLKVNGEEISYFSGDGSHFAFGHLLKDSYLVPEKVHTVSITFDKYIGEKAGAAIVFIYQ